MSESAQPFSDPEAVARYTEGPPKIVPGYEGMLRMATLLLAERASAEARVLVLGAGGGLELKAFAEKHPGWSFDGVDPAPEMLKLAAQVLGPLAPRVTLHEGYIDSAPLEPFDAATCLLTFHFMTPRERRDALTEIHRRLRPGAPFVAAHLSIPQAGGEQERALWLSRYAAFVVSSGVDPVKAENARAAIDAKLTLLTPEQDEAFLREAGFHGVSLFYAAFTFRGWVGYA